MDTDIISPWAHKFPFAGRKMTDPKERFYRQFQASASVIQEKIAELPSVSAIGGERQDAIEHILTSISHLSNEVKDAADFVPAYDQRTYSEAIKALTETVNETTAKVAPKSAFRFKPRGSNTSKQEQDPRRLVGQSAFSDADAFTSTSGAVGAGVMAEPRDFVGEPAQFDAEGGAEIKNYNEEIARAGLSGGIRKPSFSAAREVSLRDHTGIHIILPATASRATSSGSLTGLRRCIVDMSAPTRGGSMGGGAPFASLAIRDVERCLIIAGHVRGPMHITGVKDSVLVVAARQVRIHECHNVDIYLHCTSHPIIEDCAGMRFAPLPACHRGEADDPDKNEWDQVDDFKWLKSDHSPNWSTLEEGERVPEGVWMNTVPGGPSLGTEDILRKVGVGARS